MMLDPSFATMLREPRGRTQSESEASGSTFVTPQQKRRRPSHALPAHHPHRQHRKVSAPPELQAHLGHISPPTINFSSSPKVASHESFDTGSTTELIINLNNSNKLGVPEGFNSGSDSGVPSEYSSWTAPVGAHYNSLSPYEDVQTRSIGGSLEDLNHSEPLSDTDEEHDMSSQANHLQPNQPNQNQQHTTTENVSQPMVLAVNNTVPPPLVRASTETSLLSGPSPVPSLRRQRTNSMVFQLNLANAFPSNTLPNARSVSMMSLNTAGRPSGNTNTANYPNLSGMDNQSVYSDAGAPAHLSTGLLGSHYMPGMGSQGSLSGVMYGGHNGNLNYHQNPPPEEQENLDEPARHKWMLDTLCKNLSTMYAILLFMIGLVLYSADTFSEIDKSMGEAFNVYLIIVQLMWFVYIHIDVRKYINNIADALEEAREKDVKGDPVKLEPTGDGQYQIRINLPEPRRTFSQHYGFTSGRHGGSLYLKIGAAVFCLGYLIHSGLNLGQKILYLLQDDPIYESCTCTQDVLMSVLQPIYAFYQLFFIFKYSNLIINKSKRLSRFAVMHCISASFLFWAYAILQETLLAINSKKKAKYGYANMTATPAPYKITTASIIGEEMDSEEMDDDDKTFEYGYAGGKDKSFIPFSGCSMDIPLTKMINDTTPYLYPFSIEYNILIVGIWILLWENTGRIDRHTHLPSIEMTYEDDNTKGITSNFIIYVDCHSSNRGLFAGLFTTVATVISIILFFIFSADESTKAHGLLVNDISELILLLIMFVACILSFTSIRKLDIQSHKVSSVDDILLYICLPCIFLYSVFSMVPAIKYGQPLLVVVCIVKIMQAVLQTALIIDGLRRCSNTSVLNSKKPGRELITFLVVCNVALWLLDTFEIKSEQGNSFKYEFYGKEVWTLLSHLTLPLALFYRFHSSVCLVDIWKAGYEPEAED